MTIPNRTHASRTKRWRMPSILQWAYLVVALHVLLRAWATMRGFFFSNDFITIAQVTEGGLNFRLDNASGLLPGAQVWVWTLSTLFPLRWPPVALTLVAGQALTSVLMLRLLVLVFGPRPLILPALAVATMSPLSLPADIWWSAALTALPLQVTLISVLYFHLRWARQAEAGWRRFLGPLCLALGLMFTPRVMLVVPVVLIITLFGAMGPSPWRSRLTRMVGEQRAVWMAYAGSCLLFSTWVFSHGHRLAQSAVLKGTDVLDLFGKYLLDGLVPGLVGGPGSWQRIDAAFSIADPSPVLVMVAALVIVAAITITRLARPESLWAWWLAAAYTTGTFLLLLWTPELAFGLSVGSDLRHQSELAFLVAIALAFASMRATGLEAHPPAAPTHGSGLGLLIEQRLVAPLRSAGLLGPADPERALAVTGTVLVTMLSVISTLAYGHSWHENPAKGWVQTVTAQIRQLPDDTAVADGPVPDSVVWSLAHPYNQNYRVLRPLLGDRRLAEGDAATKLVIPDALGMLRVAQLSGSNPQSGPTPGCGWPVSSSPTSIRLRNHAAGDSDVLRIGYFSQQDTTTVVAVSGSSTSVSTPKGLGSIYLTLPQGAHAISIQATGKDVMCANDLEVGIPTAVPGSRP